MPSLAYHRSRPRLAILVASVGFYVLLFTARLVYEVPGGGLGLLYVLPIVVIAQEYGRTYGIVAGAAALPLWVAGGLLGPAELSVPAAGIRAVIFVVVGGLTGAMADRLRADASYFEVSRDLLCTASFEGYFTRLNGSWEQTLGWTSAELLARPFVDFVHPDDRQRTEEEASRIHRDTGTVSFTNRYRTKAGDYRWIEWASQADHRHKLIYASARDVTERHLAEQAIRAAEERFRLGFEHSPIGMAVVEAGGQGTHAIVSVNQALSDLTGYSAPELVGMRTWSELSNPDDVPEIAEGLRALLDGEIDVSQREFRLRHAQGHDVWASLTTSLLRDDDGQPLYRLSQVQDIDARKRAEEKLRYLADYDALTGVVNRRRFELELAGQTARSHSDGHAGALLVIDLDGFKQINDSRGHAAGDDVLSRVGRAVSDRLRGSDVIGRLGGDEFGALLRRASRQEAELVAGGLRAVVADEFARDLGKAGFAPIAMSIGIASFGREGDATDATALLRAADLAMYEAKTSGGDQSVAANSRVARA